MRSEELDSGNFTKKRIEKAHVESRWEKLYDVCALMGMVPYREKKR